MRLDRGTRVGPYEILSLLGAGGMGEVYRAHDARLQRDVALKVLSSTLARDPDQLHRFEREARAAAALHHPNILAVYDVGTHEGSPYIVSQLLTGETLRNRLSRGRVPVGKAIDIAMQVTRALAAAHEAGIVHRDLKPENIFLDGHDRVTLLDFGLAKLRDPAEHDPAGKTGLAQTVTSPGTILGTATYMSPEQVRGDPIDHRSDVFSAGVVLYELLAGRRPFEGRTSPDVFVSILSAEPPDLSTSTPDISPTLSRIVKLCLEKHPHDRFQTAHDLALALEAAQTGSPTPPVPVAAMRDPVPRSRRRAVWGLVAVALAGAIAVLTWRAVPFGRRDPPAPINLTIVVPPGSATADPGRLLGPPVVSPDGRAIVVALKAGTTQQLFIRHLDSGTLAPLSGTEGAVYPFWSPDSRQIAFFADARLKRVSATGGTPVALCEVPAPRGGAWGSTGTIIFATNFRGIFKCVEGSPAIELTTLDKENGENSHRYPVFLPDGLRFMYYARTDDLEKRAIYLDSIDRQAPRRRILVADGQFAIGRDPDSGSYQLLSQQAGAIMAQAFDAEGGEVQGNARAILKHAGQVSISDTGVLVVRTETQDLTRLVWFDRAGRETGTIGEPTDYWQVDLSPDDRNVAVTKHDYLSGSFAVWTGALPAAQLEPLSTTNRAISPVWSPDGSTVYYNRSNGPGVFRRRVDPRGPEEASADSQQVQLRDATADRLFGEETVSTPERPRSLVWRPLSETATWQVLSIEGKRREQPAVSPDGAWLAYVSDVSGTLEVYVTDYPRLERHHRISSGGAREPRWRAGGNELFYISAKGFLEAVDLSSGPRTVVRTPLFRLPLRRGSEGPLYDVTSDGQRFLAITAAETAVQDSIDIVLNWPSLLGR